MRQTVDTLISDKLRSTLKKRAENNLGLYVQFEEEFNEINKKHEEDERNVN